ncbi:hypothetical protein TNIN_52821 [Trichonephila inaurata madagascariensis]|uniref:Uncharacterized protein n=1 Tax=Trichonephila inaurata madagascariensis TaxID=2747483 RepID=A0A8X6X7S1_9ARAC|nr:hypothetical protein TNIN_52821 [Trichonephila inaurata madagascariensis]
MTVSKLKAERLDIMICRGQAYDNAAAMAGCPSKKANKDINPKSRICSIAKPVCDIQLQKGKFGDFFGIRTLLLFFLRRGQVGKFLNPQGKNLEDSGHKLKARGDAVNF